jgi:hypothetical protein
MDGAQKPVTNGAGAAAVMAAGAGCFAVGVLAVLGDVLPAFKKAMIFYKPTGPLSGVTTVAVMVWLAVWGLLEWRWGRRDVRMGRVGAAAFVLLALGLMLTFPPIAELF